MEVYLLWGEIPRFQALRELKTRRSSFPLEAEAFKRLLIQSGENEDFADSAAAEFLSERIRMETLPEKE